MPIGERIDGEALRDRWVAARKLSDEGFARAEVTRPLEVSRQSVNDEQKASTLDQLLPYATSPEQTAQIKRVIAR